MKYAAFAVGFGLLVLGLASRPSLAATASASFAVTATVVDTCRVGATSATNSATYAAAVKNPSSAVSVQCVLNTPYNVSLRTGQAIVTAPDVAGITPRTLVDSELPSSAHPVNRGLLPSSQPAVKSGSSSSQPLVAYGKGIAALSDASSGYPDSILVTVAY